MTSDNTVSGEMLPVEQRHRDAFAAICTFGKATKETIREGRYDKLPGVQAFARFERDHMPSTPSVDGEMLEALAPFAAMADWAGEGFADDDTVDAVSYCGLTIGDCRRARAVIARATGAA